jgi:MFS family permease
MVRALRHRNFKLFFIGQGLSLIGTWLTKVAMYWLVYQLARDTGHIKAATTLGIVSFVSNVPMFLFAPFAGVFVDRFNRHHVIVFTQIMAMLQSAALAVLTLGHWITIPQVIGLALFQGMIDSLDAPARQSFIIEMVDDPVDLANAIALQSSIFNGARLLGPAIGGLLLVRLSAGWCFAIDATSYLAVIAGLLMMRLKPRPPRLQNTDVFADFAAGIRYTFGFPPLRAILMLVAMVSFSASALQTLMPILADGMRGGPAGAATFGFLMASIGVGAFFGAIYLASRRTVVGLARVMCIAAMILGGAMSCVVLTHTFYVALLFCAACGFGMVTHFASGNTMLQTITEDALRGRVMSFFTMLVIGTAPFGALLAGWLSDRIGAPLVVHIYSGLALFATLLFLRSLPELRRLVRPIYMKKGIIPEVAMALAMDAQEER